MFLSKIAAFTGNGLSKVVFIIPSGRIPLISPYKCTDAASFPLLLVRSCVSDAYLL